MSAPAAATTPNPFSSETLAAKVLEKLGASPPTADTILRSSAELAVLVNKTPGLKGPEKMALVQHVLRDIVNMPDVRSKLSDETIAVLNGVIDTIVPTTLTLIVSAGRGEFDLKKVVSWSWCCSKRAVAVKTDTVSAEKGVGSVVVAEVTVEMPGVAPTSEEAEAVAVANNAPTESESLTPAP